ncbi:hypothetical protein V8E36_004896 [Tilletia maclaganii]
MQELRRVRSGARSENDSIVTMHDVLDAAQWLSDNHRDESYLRRVIRPLESPLRQLQAHRRQGLGCQRWSATAPSSCFPVSSATRPGARSDQGRGHRARHCAERSMADLSTCDHGVVARVKRCIMERDTYPRRWDPRSGRFRQAGYED